MNSQVDQIARAVLYEGYLLYPYRHSAFKNQQRWNFGVLYPPSWSATQTGADRSYFQMECLAQCSQEAELEVSVRFLQIVKRRGPSGGWREAVERCVNLGPIPPSTLTGEVRIQNFFYSGEEKKDGEVVVSTSSVEGRAEVSSIQIQPDISRLSVQVRNTGACAAETRDHALMHSLASAHAVLQLRRGKFVSQIDPPEDLRGYVAECQNVGVWPVLVGEPGGHDTMLGSPIILYDYPQIASESKGDLFDGTEIDEILTLRILTLSDAEKEEVRRSDPKARRILERLETSPPEHLLELHGVMRGARAPERDAWSAWDTVEGRAIQSFVVQGVELKKGDRVRLRPRNRADIFDTLLEGKTAVIEAVEQDLEDKVHFAVVVEDDPGRDLGELRQAGHRFFYSAEELEPFESVKSEKREL